MPSIVVLPEASAYAVFMVLERLPSPSISDNGQPTPPIRGVLLGMNCARANSQGCSIGVHRMLMVKAPIS